MFAVLLCLVIAGCKPSKETQTPATSEETTQATEIASAEPAAEASDVEVDFNGEKVVIHDDSTPPRGHPGDFFPTLTDTRWVYTIKLGTVDPLMYDETNWPLGAAGEKKSVTYAVRGLLRGALRNENPPLRLEFSVAGPVDQQGPLEYPNGVELKIARDDLGVFRRCERAFWAIGESGRYSAFLVLTFDRSSSDAPGGGGGVGWGEWGQEDGHSKRFHYFVSKPGISLSEGDSGDALLFTGIERKLDGFDGDEFLHFIRKVKPSEKKAGEEPGYLDQGFREDTWFARGKGLVKLVQTVGGKTSMTWELTSFTRGRE
jgi:hypothetical protein